MSATARRIDTHVHLTHVQQNMDWQEQRRLCLEAGVVRLLDAGLHPVDFAEREAILRDWPEVFFGVAIAPHHHRSERAAVADLAPQLGHPRVVALSEIGLDDREGSLPMEEQKSLFAELLELAAAEDVPVFLHIRGAWSEALRVLKASRCRRGAVHCFSAGPDEARAFLDLEFHLSFSGILTFKNAPTVHEAARLCPADRMLTETDAPWLAPVPHRGKKNHAALIVHTNQFLADLRRTSLEEVETALWNNAADLLGLPR